MQVARDYKYVLLLDWKERGGTPDSLYSPNVCSETKWTIDLFSQSEQMSGSVPFFKGEFPAALCKSNLSLYSKKHNMLLKVQSRKVSTCFLLSRLAIFLPRKGCVLIQPHPIYAPCMEFCVNIYPA